MNRRQRREWRLEHRRVADQDARRQAEQVALWVPTYLMLAVEGRPKKTRAICWVTNGSDLPVFEARIEVAETNIAAAYFPAIGPRTTHASVLTWEGTDSEPPRLLFRDIRAREWRRHADGRLEVA